MARLPKAGVPSTGRLPRHLKEEAILPPPRIGCIRAGYYGRNLVDNFHGLRALAAVCDSSAAARADLSVRYPDVRWSGEVRDLLKDSERTGVAIAMPAKTHGALVRRSLQAGKDVFVEKPFRLDTDEGERLVQLSQHHGRLLMFGEPAVMPPGVLKLRELVHAGDLGCIQYMYSKRRRDVARHKVTK